MIYSLTEPAIELVPGIARPAGSESVLDRLRAAYEAKLAKVS